MIASRSCTHGLTLARGRFPNELRHFCRVRHNSTMSFIDYPRTIDKIFGKFTGPRFSVKLWDGQEYFYGTGTSKTFTLTIRDKAMARRLLMEGDFGFGEAYVEGRITVGGDLEACLRLQHELNYAPGS